ncbi:hypothetical protein BLSTO_05100 [Blastocystis sp. subtype 1]
MWLQVATLAHVFTSSQEVTCRYSLRAIASTVVPLFHSATLYDHECESLMHPDEQDGDYINAGMLESARGWVTTILFNKELKVQFEAYYTSPDTFSLALLGVWVAHGEGRCFWPNDEVKEEAMRQNCVALKYVDDGGSVATENWKVLVV